MDLVRKYERPLPVRVGSREFNQVLKSVEGSDPTGSQDPASAVYIVNWELFVTRVSIFAEDGQNGKPRFSISLELDPGLDPSNRSRRTERVTSLTLEVEEKELPIFARLAGRGVEISSERQAALVQNETLESRISELQEVIRKLQIRREYLEEQLQFTMDQLRTSS
jgi:hypothetical protein